MPAWSASTSSKHFQSGQPAFDFLWFRSPLRKRNRLLFTGVCCLEVAGSDHLSIGAAQYRYMARTPHIGVYAQYMCDVHNFLLLGRHTPDGAESREEENESLSGR